MAVPLPEASKHSEFGRKGAETRRIRKELILIFAVLCVFVALCQHTKVSSTKPLLEITRGDYQDARRLLE